METYNITRNGLAYRINKPMSTISIMRIPYNQIKNFEYQSFLVYILVNQYKIYVGKSKNGLLNRPTSHSDNWSEVYLIYDTNNNFNDGIIQQLENAIYNKINETNAYDNQTKLTNTNTSSVYEQEFIDGILNDIYYMLYGLGLDLIHKRNISYELPSGEYIYEYESLNRLCSAYIDIYDNEIRVLADSEISDNIDKGCPKNIINLKQSEMLIVSGILQYDIVFKDIESALCFITGKKIKNLRDIKKR